MVKKVLKDIVVTEGITCIIQKPPVVKKALKNIVVTEGSKAKLDATIVGVPEPECIWYHGGKWIWLIILLTDQD